MSDDRNSLAITALCSYLCDLLLQKCLFLYSETPYLSTPYKNANGFHYNSISYYPLGLSPSGQF